MLGIPENSGKKEPRVLILSASAKARDRLADEARRLGQTPVALNNPGKDGLREILAQGEFDALLVDELEAPDFFAEWGRSAGVSSHGSAPLLVFSCENIEAPLALLREVGGYSGRASTVHSFAAHSHHLGGGEAELTSRHADLVGLMFYENPQPILIYDPKSLQFLEVNPAAERVYGFSKSEFLALRLPDIVPEQDMQRFRDEALTLILSGREQWGTWRHLRKDGTVFHAELKANPIRYQDRNARLVLVTDLTARRETEASLAESQRLLASLMSDIPGMVYRCQNADSWPFIYASHGCAGLTGYPAEDFVSGKVQFGDLIHIDDRKKVWDDVQTALEVQEPYELLYRIVTADGELKWVWEKGRGVPGPKGNLLYLEGLITDITPLKRTEDALHRQIERTTSLRTIDMAILQSIDIRSVLEVIMDQVTTHLDVDAAAVFLLDDGSQILELAVRRGFQGPVTSKLEVKLGTGLAGRIARSREPVCIPNLNEGEHQPLAPLSIREERFVTFVGVPLIARGRVNGVLELFHRTHFEPEKDWFDFLEALAGQAAIAIDNANLFEEYQRSNSELILAYDTTLEGWSRALDLRDQETEGHTRRVASTTVRLARSLGIRGEQLANIRRGALLHDIGKMAIPDTILLKPGPLNDEEWDVMRKHPVYAYDLLSPIPFLRPALDIPYCHHERWDGSGYPRGLQEEHIPLAARIFAVVDVWDALGSDRPYRGAWQDEDIRRYLTQHAGVQFDPAVVSAFQRLLGNGHSNGH